MNTKQIDDNLDAVLRASGSALKHYSMQLTLDNMRAAMSKAMRDPVRDDLVAALEGMLPTNTGYCNSMDWQRYDTAVHFAKIALSKAKGE